MRAVVASGMALIAATYGLARFGYGLFLPQFTETFAMGSMAAGVISAGSFVSYCLSAVLAFRISAHPRRMVLSAGTAATVGSLGVAASPDVRVLALSVLVAGGGAGFASPGLVVLIQRNVPPARQESAQTIVNSGTGAGIVVAGIVMLLTLGHWRLGWLVIAVVVLVATAATLHADATAAPKRVCQASAPRSPARIGDLDSLSWPIVSAAMAGMSSAAVWTFGPSIMTSASSNDTGYATIAWMVLGAFGVLGATAGKIVQTWSLQIAWGTTCLAMATATIALGGAPGSPLVAFAAVAAFGASYTALSGVLIVWAVRITPEHAAEASIALFIALAVGQALGAAALGLLQDFAPHVVTFSLAGLIGLLAPFPARKGARFSSP